MRGFSLVFSVSTYMTNTQLKEFQEDCKYLPGESGMQRQTRLINAGYDRSLVYEQNILDAKAHWKWIDHERSAIPERRTNYGLGGIITGRHW